MRGHLPISTADERESSYALAKMTARVAIFRQHAQGKDPFVMAAVKLKTFMSSLCNDEDLDKDDLMEPVIIEDEVVEGNVGVADEAVQAKEVAVEATDAADKEVAADSMVEEGVAEDTPPV